MGFQRTPAFVKQRQGFSFAYSVGGFSFAEVNFIVCIFLYYNLVGNLPNFTNETGAPNLQSISTCPRQIPHRTGVYILWIKLCWYF